MSVDEFLKEVDTMDQMTVEEFVEEETKKLTLFALHWNAHLGDEGKSKGVLYPKTCAPGEWALQLEAFKELDLAEEEAASKSNGKGEG